MKKQKACLLQDKLLKSINLIMNNVRKKAGTLGR